MGMLQRKAQETFNTTPADMTSGDGMIELDKMDEAAVRHERCPMCKFNPLDRIDGFKVCPRCETTFKVLDGIGYVIDYRKSEVAPKNPQIEVQNETGGMSQMSNRIIKRMQKIAGENKIDMAKLEAIPIAEIEAAIKCCYTGDLENPDTQRLYVSIWETIQDNFDVCTDYSLDPTDNYYLSITPDVKKFIDNNDLFDSATYSK